MNTENKAALTTILESLSEDELKEVPNIILEVRNERLLRTLQPGDRVVTLEAGFSGYAGVECYFLGFVKKGDPNEEGSTWGGDYATFGPYKDGEVRWVLSMDELSSVKKL